MDILFGWDMLKSRPSPLRSCNVFVFPYTGVFLNGFLFRRVLSGSPLLISQVFAVTSSGELELKAPQKVMMVSVSGGSLC